MGIAFMTYYANLYSSQGLLTETDFLYFYIHHSLEVNTFLFVVGLVFMLYAFLSMFFRTMDMLLKTLHGEQKRTPISFLLFPQFRLAKEKVEMMLAKRNENQALFLQEKEHKNELLMYLAHDLKTPLTSMIGYINHILDHNVDQKQQETSIHIAYEKAERLDNLIDEFSEILRYDDKVSQLVLSRIDVNLMLQQQLAGFYPLMEKRRIAHQVDLPQDFYVNGDYDKLLRVFDNLMRNAINYSNPNATIAIRGRTKRDTIELSYTNEAEAIDEETLHHLFDKFYRASTARTTTSGGAGLGLAIAKEIIELHHGSIAASIQDNKITFTITLPIVQGVLI